MNEKSIRKIYKRSTIITFVLITIISLLLIVYFNQSIHNEKINKCSSVSVSFINNMISSLNRINVKSLDSNAPDFETFSQSEGVSEELNYFHDKHEAFLNETVILGFDYSSKAINDFPELTFTNKQSAPFISRLGDIAREINANRDKNNEEMKILSNVITIISFIMLIFILIILIISYTFQNKYFFTVEETIEEMKSIIEGVDRTSKLDPKCMETTLMYEKVKEIEKKVRFQNELLKHDSFGMLESILPQMYPLLKSQMDIQRLAVAFADKNGNVIAETLKTEKPRVLLSAGFKASLEKTSLIHLKSENDVRIIDDLEDYYMNVHRNSSTWMILEEGFRSSITVPMYTQTGLLGFIFANNERKEAFGKKDEETMKQFAKTLKSEIYNAYLMQELIAKTSEAFADLVEKKDFETGNHLSRVANYSRLMAQKLMEINPLITPKLIREIFWFAPLHDIGKVGIPDKILLKPGKLTFEEYEYMKKHVDIGAQVIYKMNKTLIENTNIHFLDTCIKIISEHHEKWDGSGYPKGLKGEEISIPGRIVAIADVFDALISERIYKPAFSAEKAFGIIAEGRGRHFCPALTDIFLNSKDEIMRIMHSYED
ncbi:MAG: HD domain-containing phosphohydrolase [Thermotogota bacterium]